MTNDKGWKYRQTQVIMQIIRHTKETGRCAECGKPVAHWSDTSEARMVCASLVCYRNWLLPGSRYDTAEPDEHEEQEIDF